MPNTPPLPRRALVAGSVGAVVAAALSACGSRESAGTPTAGAPAAASDTELVEEVSVSIAGLMGYARGITRVPGLRTLAQPFVALHHVHLERLGWSGKAHGGDATASREAFLDAERRLQAHLVRAAGQAESGALAQVFASMAAAVAQQVAVS